MTPQIHHSIFRFAVLSASFLPCRRQVSFAFHGIYAQASPRLIRCAAEQYTVELQRPLGIRVQEALDGAVYVVSSVGNAAEAGVKPGDVVIKASAVFGDDLWDVRSAGLKRVESLIKTRQGDTVRLELESGHRYHLQSSSEDDLLNENFATDIDSYTMKSIYGRYDDTPSEEDQTEDEEDDLVARLLTAIAPSFPEQNTSDIDSEAER